MGLFPAVGEAGTWRCPPERITVEADTEALAMRICGVALQATGLANMCGYGLERDIAIKVVPRIIGMNGNPLACFKAAQLTVEVLKPEATATTLTSRSAYSRLPPDALYDSLIVHEMTHAMFSPAGPRTAQTVVAQEYIASSFQIASMDADVRQILLDRYPRHDSVSLSELNVAMYSLAPVRFGVTAWRHYAQAENGCAILQQIVEGAIALGAGDP
jgi:hypothetical protein